MSLNSKRRQPLGAAVVLGAIWLTGNVAEAQTAGAGAAPPAPAGAPAPSDASPAPEADTRRVDVFEYLIEGNTVLPAEDIEIAVQPFLGPQRTVTEIEQARAALEQAYRKKGYETVGVEIPEQDVRSGVVRFNVLELSVGRLRVTGTQYYSPELIKERVPSLAEGTVPRYDLVSKDIERVNNARDRTITPTLRAGVAPGTVDVDLEVDDRAPFHGSFEVNDRYSSQTTRLRAVASLSYANLFQRDHSLSFQAQVAPEKLDEMFLVTASYLAPIRGTNFSVVAYGMHSDSDVAAVGGIDVIGKGDIFGMRGMLSLPGSSKLMHSVLAGFDYKSFNEDLVLGADTAATPIDYVPFTLEYSLTALDKTGDTSLRTSLNWGSRGLGSTNEEFALKRYGARANFMYFRADLTRTQKLPAGFRATLALSGQVSDQPLISNEGFSLGGLESVRGYAESQALGDSGVRASLQFDTPSLFSRPGNSLNEWRLFVFGDWGRVHINQALADTNGVVTENISLASAGAGMQLRGFERFNALLLLAAPLKDKDSVDFDVDDQYRAQFRVWTEF